MTNPRITPEEIAEMREYCSLATDGWLDVSGWIERSHQAINGDSDTEGMNGHDEDFCLKSRSDLPRVLLALEESYARDGRREGMSMFPTKEEQEAGRRWIESMTRTPEEEKRAAAEERLRDCERRALAMVEWLNYSIPQAPDDSAWAITRDARQARAEIETLEKGDAE